MKSCKHEATEFLGWQECYGGGWLKLVNCIKCHSTISAGFYTDQEKQAEENESTKQELVF